MACSYWSFANSQAARTPGSWRGSGPRGRSAGQLGRERPDMVEGRELRADPAAKTAHRALREADNFATTSGVADMDRVGQVALRDGRREVVGVCVHVIAVPTAVVGDAAVAAGGETHQLVFPSVGAQWPA